MTRTARISGLVQRMANEGNLNAWLHYTRAWQRAHKPKFAKYVFRIAINRWNTARRLGREGTTCSMR